MDLYEGQVASSISFGEFYVCTSPPKGEQIYMLKLVQSKERNVKHTRKSTPIVALLSSSGSHCSSENRRRRLLLPTEEFPMSKSLQFMGVVVDLEVGAIEYNDSYGLKRRKQS